MKNTEVIGLQELSGIEYTQIEGGFIPVAIAALAVSGIGLCFVAFQAGYTLGKAIF